MSEERTSPTEIETDRCVASDQSTCTSSNFAGDVEFRSPGRACPHLPTKERCKQLSFWVKYSAFVLNFILMFSGCLMFVIGGVVKIQRASYGDLEDVYTNCLWLLITVGIIVFISSVIGCIGALRENITFLKVFIIITGVVFLLESTTGIMSFILLTDMEHNVQKMLYQSISSYNTETHSTDFMDRVQKSLSCCGVKTYNDWEQNSAFNCSSSQISSCGVPASCCRIASNIACGYQVRKFLTSYANAYIYLNGCMPILIEQFKSNLVVIGLVAFCVGVLEIVAMMLGHLQIRHILFSQKMSL